MQEQSNKKHNVAVIIITVSCIGCVIEGIIRSWEFWAMPLIKGGKPC